MTLSSRIKIILACTILCSISLSIPTISSISSLFLPILFSLFGYLRKLTNFSPKYRPILALSITSILLFSIYNYYQVYNYQLDSQSLGSIVRSFLLINILFFTGACLNLKKIPFFPYNVIMLNLLLFSGGVVFVFLSVAKHTRFQFALGKFLVVRRQVPAFWQSDISGAIINGPSLDMFSYLGLSLIGLMIVVCIFFTKKLSLKAAYVIICLLTLILMSIYSSIALGARTPVIVFTLCIFATLAFVYGKRTPTLFACINLGAVFIAFSNDIGKLLQDSFKKLFKIGIGNRLASKGLDTNRYDAWAAAIGQIFDYPWGGRLMDIKGLNYVHNIWLDQLYDAGVISMILLVVFHTVQIIIIVRALQLNLPLVIKVFILCTTIGFLAAFIQAPVLQASVLYFAISCFFFGSIESLVYEYEGKRFNGLGYLRLPGQS